MSDHKKDEAYWIRYTLLCPKSPIKRFKRESIDNFIDSLGGDGMLWFGYFNAKDPSKNYIIKKVFLLSSVIGSQNDLIIRIQDADISIDKMKGGFETNGGNKVSWDLSFSHFMEPLIVTPNIAKKLGVSNTVVKSAHPNIRVTGNITINNDTKDIKDASGIQYHTYGDGYLDPWTWLSCHTFKEAPDGYLDFGYKIIRSIATAEFFDGNESITWWNASMLKKMKLMKKYQFERFLNGFKFKVEFQGTTIEADITTPIESLLAVEYFGPLGNTFYCYNSEVGDCRVIVIKKDEEGKIIEKREFTAKKNVSFENVYESPQEGIRYLPWDKEEI